MIEEITNGAYSEIILGIILIIVGFAMFYYIRLGSKNTSKDDYPVRIFQNQQYTGAFLFLIAGVYFIIKELTKLI